MATAIRLQETDTRNTDYSLGAWVYNNQAGIRNYLYSTKLSVNPYMYTTANTVRSPPDDAQKRQLLIPSGVVQRSPRHRRDLGHDALRGHVEPYRQARPQHSTEAYFRLQRRSYRREVPDHEACL